MDLEKHVANKEKMFSDNDFKDLVYDLESFIIDSFYDNEGKQENSKCSLVLKLVDEKERAFVYSSVSPILVSLGIHESVFGFRLLLACVLEAARCILTGKSLVMKEIYKAVSSLYGISVNNCERLCRYACSHISISRGFSQAYPYLEGLTHRTFEKITVKELVESLCSYLIVECKFKTRINNAY